MKKEYNIKFNIDKYIKNIINKENIKIIPIFIPHLGCNNDCVFCNQRKISGNQMPKKLEDVKTEIEENLNTIDRSNNIIQIAFFGGSFTGLTIEQQIKYLELANEYIKEGRVDSIRISTRPDYINKDILELLKKYNVKTIELGVQSMDEEVLLLSKRGHTSLDVRKSARLIKLFNFELGFQIMVGLPNSSLEKEINTIRILKRYKPKYLRIYPVYVLEDSQLYDMYKNKEYIPLGLDFASFVVALIIVECMNTDIKIIRIGLQSTLEISSSNTNLIGPVSDNFADYAISQVVIPYLEYDIRKYIKIKDEKQLVNIITNKRYLSWISGPNKIHKKYLEEKYNIKLKFKGEV